MHHVLEISCQQLVDEEKENDHLNDSAIVFEWLARILRDKARENSEKKINFIAEFYSVYLD